MAKMCSGCGEILEDNINICPKCNSILNEGVKSHNKIKNFNSKLITLFVLIILLLIGYLLTYNLIIKKMTKTNLNYNTNKTYSINDTIPCPNFDITITDYIIKEKGTKLNEEYYIDDPEWIGLILKIKNTTSSERRFLTDNITIKNSSNVTLKPLLLSYNIWNTELINNPYVKSGEEITGYIQFKNTEDNNDNLIANVNCDNVFESKIYKIKLQK